MVFLKNHRSLFAPDFLVWSMILLFPLCLRSEEKKEPMIAGGGYHSLALNRDGALWGWGFNGRGQLGDGTTIDRYLPFPSKPPAALKKIIAIAAGEDHSMALASDGTVWTFGNNDCGQLGNGTTHNLSIMAQVGGLKEIKAIACGQKHSLALDSNGNIWSWGLNAQGQLGDGTLQSSKVPIRVSGLQKVIAITAGANHSLAIREDGTVWTWGSNDTGQLGDGTLQNRSQAVKVGDLKDITMIAGGIRNSAALKKDGTVWIWGGNEHGQLGNGNMKDSFIPIQVPTLNHVRLISAGYEHFAALKADGTIWTWGDNNLGQLGNDISSYSPKPLPVSPPENADSFKNITSIVCGAYHTIFLGADDSIWTCGHNFFGQLGNWSTSDSSVVAPLWKQCLKEPIVKEE